MKNNIKKAYFKFGKAYCIFSVLYRFLSLPQMVITTTLKSYGVHTNNVLCSAEFKIQQGDNK